MHRCMLYLSLSAFPYIHNRFPACLTELPSGLHFPLLPISHLALSAYMQEDICYGPEGEGSKRIITFFVFFNSGNSLFSACFFSFNNSGASVSNNSFCFSKLMEFISFNMAFT